jgi:phosphoribosylanthranilate isomerase
MNIKVCGITQLKQLQQLEALDIDFAGLIFYKDSPRYVGDKIPGKELKSADFDIKKVGVFVNADYDEIMKIVESYSLDLVQLHGDESPDLCSDLSDEVEVIKTFRISDDSAQQIDKLIMPYDEACDYCLFDTAGGSSFGGTGKKFDWDALSKSKIEKPFFISGGISVDDADALKAFKHPDLFAVDINSKFEIEPGVKDMKLILQFREALKRK